MNDGLKDSHRAAVIGVIAANERVERALLFGSRATETHTVTSDIDIALFGDRLTLTDQAKLVAAAEELAIPQRVDFLLHTMIDSDTLRKHIERNGVEWYRRLSRQEARRLRLSPKHWVVIQALLCEHLPGVEVWDCGRRVTGSSHDGSNLDLVLRGPGLKEIPAGQVADFEEAVRDSMLPFQVEARDWAQLSERFREQVEREHVLLRNGARAFPPTRLRVALADLIDLRLSSVDKKSRLNEIPVRLCNYTDVYYNSTIRKNMFFMEATASDREIAKCALSSGDVVITKDSEKYDDIGVPAFVMDDVPDLVCGYHLAILRPDAARIHGRYLFYALNANDVQTQFHHYANGITRFALRKADIGLIEVPLPCLEEQRAIAHVLGTLDDKIELNRRMNETLEAIARAIFKDWFVDFGPTRGKSEGQAPYLAPELWDLFPDALNDEGRPEGWEPSEIGKEVDAVGGSTPSTKYPSYWEGGEHHWATPKDLSKLSSPVLIETDRKITDAGVKKISSGLLPVGTVLLSSRAPIGYLAVSEVPTAVNQGFIAMICQKRLSNVFVLFWCHENLDYIKGISGGSTFAEISKKAFRPIPVIVPSEEVLAAYEGLVRPLYDHIVGNTKETLPLAQTRDLLLPKLVSGEIRLREAEKAVEAVA